MIIAAILLALYTAVKGGVWHGGPGWIGWAGLTLMAISFLVP